MGKKRRGHYCFGCGRYRANEKFCGKGVNIDEDGPYIEGDFFEYEPTGEQATYLKLIPEIEAVIQKRVQEEEDHLLNLMFGYIEE
jgi:hypothetical protein